ncbi:MAG: hypothetical protein IPM51_05870 [Sphingobacteriaceae bacterium]|nr:hypothetical protein [Sphingobacteriaceae bacterium]
MFRIVIIIFSVIVVFSSCVKKPSKSPIPTLEFNDFQAWKVRTNIDTAVLILNYEDGDGDIFLDIATQGPNVIGTFYYLNSATGKFTAIKDNITNDTARITQTIIQPKDASYKNKSIRGEIYLPMSPFRSGDSVKTFKYTFFVTDVAGNKSNTITTPELKVTF